MKPEKFLVKNVKCVSCSNIIRTGLGKLAGVSFVRVEMVHGEVVVQGKGLSRADLAAKLKELGYPEA